MIPGRLRPAYPISGPVFEFQVTDRDGTVRVTLDGEETALMVHCQGNSRDPREGWCRTPDGRSHSFASSWVGSTLHLWLDGDLFVFEPVERTPVERTPGSARQPIPIGMDILAPMPGTVVQVLVEVGGRVEPGDRLFIMESMKMELVIDSPRGGVVKGISVTEGSQVDQGMRLLEFEEPTRDG